ncbi:HGGxSTG domain-containing protein [Propionibacteriaceae bacterium Y1700]|uniref:HGGxSTG domain-containing protein n=1 Tax=Microlunatus sp. Y1700 TaxID=3418487 RepID=UPI003DA797A8
MPTSSKVEVHAERNICGAKTRSGEPCTQRPLLGGKRCRMHGGKSRGALANNARRVLEAEVRGVLVERGWSPVLNPIPAMAELAGETVAFKDLAREKLNELTRWDHEDDKGSEQERAMVTVYQRALADAFSMLEKMARLGLDAEALRQAIASEQERPTREQAAQLAAWLTGMLDAITATPEQRAAAIEYLTSQVRGATA